MDFGRLSKLLDTTIKRYASSYEFMPQNRPRKRLYPTEFPLGSKSYPYVVNLFLDLYYDTTFSDDTRMEWLVYHPNYLAE